MTKPPRSHNAVESNAIELPPAVPCDVEALLAHRCPRGRSTGSGAPRWLWWIVLVVPLAVATHCAVGLILAMLNWYDPWVTMALGTALTVVGIPSVGTSIQQLDPSVDRSPRGHIAAAGMAALAVSSLLFTAQRVGQHIVTERDPGGYATTARWLAREGSLALDVATSGPLSKVPGVVFTSPATYLMADSRVEFQFNHGTSVVMATAYEFARPWGMFLAGAACGSVALLALYVAATNVTRSRVVAFGTSASLGLSAPFLFVTRSTYSEPFVLMLVSASLALLLAARRPIPAPAATLVGAFAGATAMFRVDAQLIGIALVGVVTIALAARLVTKQGALVMLAAALPGLVIGRIDLAGFTGDYFSDLRSEVLLLDLGLAGALITAFGVAMRPGSTPVLLASRVLPRVATAGSMLVVVAGLMAWLVRPHVQRSRGSWAEDSSYATLVRLIQVGAGEPIEPLRSYAEYSVSSIGWYFGPVLVAFAIAGLAVLTNELAKGVVTWRSVLLPVFIITGPLYLWNPHITPDQLWATRRQVSMILPVLILAAAVGIDRCQDASTGKARRLGELIATASLVAGAIVGSWPVRNLSDQRGFLQPVGRVCQELSSSNEVLVLDDARLPVPLRAWCGVEAGALPSDAPTTHVAMFLDAVSEGCVNAHLASADPATLAPYADRLGRVNLFAAESLHSPQRTLDHPPQGYDWQRLSIAVAPVVLPRGC